MSELFLLPFLFKTAAVWWVYSAFTVKRLDQFLGNLYFLDIFIKHNNNSRTLFESQRLVEKYPTIVVSSNNGKLCVLELFHNFEHLHKLQA